MFLKRCNRGTLSHLERETVPITCVFVKASLTSSTVTNVISHLAHISEFNVLIIISMLVMLGNTLAMK